MDEDDFADEPGARRVTGVALVLIGAALLLFGLLREDGPAPGGAVLEPRPGASAAQLPPPPSGNVQPLLTVAEAAPPSADQGDSSPSADPAAPTDVSLELTLRVLDIDRRPVHGARVRMWSLDESSGRAARDLAHRRPADPLDSFLFISTPRRDDEPGLRLTHDPARGEWITGPDGRVRIALPDDSAVLVADHVDAGSSGRVYASDGLRDRGDEAELRLRPRGELRGSVLDADGAPIAGARVDARPGESMFSFDGALTRARVPAACSSDAEGRFTLTVDTPFRGRVSASLGGRTSADTAVVVLPGSAEFVALRLGSALSLNGVVTDETGAPVARAFVALQQGSRRDFDWLTTGDDGRFAVPLAAPGAYTVMAWTDLARGAREAVVELDGSQADVRLVLRPITSIEGRVLWSDGTPAADVLVAATEDGIDERAEHADWDDMTRCTTTESGAFRVIVCAGDSYTLACAPLADAPPTRVPHVAPGATDVRVQLDLAPGPAATVTLSVVDEHGAPVTDYELDFVPFLAFPELPRHGPSIGRAESGMIRGRQVSDPQGRAEVLADPSGRPFAAVIDAPGHWPRIVGPITSGPEGLEQTIVLGRAGPLTVRVVDEHGAPIAAAHVEVLPRVIDDDESHVTRCSLSTDTDGVARFTILAAGDWAVGARGPLGRTASTERLTLAPRAPAELVLRLR